MNVRTRTLRYARLLCAVLGFFVFLVGGCGQMQPQSSGPFSSLIGVYRGPLNHLSAVRHGTCPMHPSCSEYAKQSVAKHGELIGWFMACDRLMRCGRDETRHAPMVRVGDGFRVSDPVARNDFWWAAPDPVFTPAPGASNETAPAAPDDSPSPQNEGHSG
ncbi:MAG: membrane protein insertion efficiency factor YidD [Thermodesulfobacteriota bacterium]